MEDATTPLVIGITSAGSGIGHAVIKSMARARDRYRIVGLDLSLRNVSMSKLQHRAVLPRVLDTAKYKRALLALVEEFSIDFLIPCLDPELTVVAGLRPRLLELGCVPIVSEISVTRLSSDKEALAQFCADRGLPMVRTESLTVALSIANELHFPLIVKPRTGSGSGGAQLVVDPAGLTRVGDVDNFVVQEYLPPRTLDGALAPAPTRVGLDQRHELSVQYALDRDGATLGRFASINQLKNGVPVVIEPVTGQVDLSGADRLIAALAAEGARGPVNLQGRIGADGKPVYFEINARFTGITCLRGLLGFREVEAVIQSFAGGQAEDVAEMLVADETLIGFRPVDDVVIPLTSTLRAPTHHAKEQGSMTRRLGRVVVTGSGGYLGRALVDALCQDPTVESLTLLSRRPADTDDRLDGDGVRLRTRSIRDFAHGYLGPADTVFHLAARRPDKPHTMHEMFAGNMALTSDVTEGAYRAHAQRVVVASTQAVYGTSRPPLWHESMPPMPESLYAASKWASEVIAGAASRTEMTTTSVRLARLFGVASGMRWSELPHQWVEKAVIGKPLIMVGDGEQRLDLLDVLDAVKALIAISRCADPRADGPMNVGSGNPLSLAELAGVVTQEAFTRGCPEVVLERRAATASQPGFGMSIDRARTVTGWQPEYSMVDSVRRLIAAAHERIDTREPK